MNKTARIYQPAKTAMQSGTAATKKWLLEFEPDNSRSIDPLMGWTGSADTIKQLRLEFDSADAAVAYAEKNGLSYVVSEPHKRKFNVRSYADNFSHKRIKTNSK